MTIVVTQGQSPSNQSLVDMPSQVNFNPMENVVKNVERFLQLDSAFPQLIDMIKGNAKTPTVSGLTDNDYPNLNEFGAGLNSLSQFSQLYTIPFPSGLNEQFAHMQQNCEMGIFPEIGRAWISIDSNLYIWRYDNGSDVAYYDALDEIILQVGLVKPKPGIFKSHIKYLLCITTAVEIILLGLTFSDEEDQFLLLVPDRIFSVPTDNVVMKVIRGTADGRIFLGGKDGCVYEVVYQAQEGWFSSRCKKINHSTNTLSFLIPSFIQGTRDDSVIQLEIDESRHILYSLTEKGTIEVFDLGQSGQSMSRIVSKTIQSLVREASYYARTIDQNNFKPIIGISALENSESICVNLIVITESGLRLYYSTNSSSIDERPCELSLVHIRLPPGFSASSSFQKPSAVHICNYKRGNLLMLSTPSQIENKNVLWAINNDMFAFENDLMELCTVIPLNSRIFKLCEEIKPMPFKPFQMTTLKNNKVVSIEPPLMLTQHMEEPRKFVFISSEGIHLGFKPRVSDQLRQLLIENNGFENDAVKSFFGINKSAQACAVALILACGCKAPQESKVAEWATLAFFRFGGEPHFESYQTPGHYPVIQQQLQQSPISQPQNTSFSLLKQPLFSSPIQQASSPSHFIASPSNLSPIRGDLMPSESATALSFRFSDKHDGVYLYFSRIIRPIWYLNTVRSEQAIVNNEMVEKFMSSIASSEITIYETKLNDLRNFLKSNVQFSVTEEISHQFDKRFSKSNEAQAKERNSLYNLLKLIEHCIEVLGLWKMLCDHQFHVIGFMLPGERQKQLKSMNFRDLFDVNCEMTTILASSLVRRYIEDNSTTDLINNRLHEVCPSIYKQENALHAKAHEMVMKSKSLVNAYEKEDLLKKALDLCTKIGERINLTAICELFQSANYYEAIVNLCLITAQRRDPQNLALHYYRVGEPDEDQQGKAAFIIRSECYRLLLEVYERLVQQSKLLISPKSISESTSDGVINSELAKTSAQRMLEAAVSSKDELFHIALYNWLYEHQQSGKLLEIKSPYLEGYLKRKTSTFSDSIALMDLLWMYYERNGHFRAAAQILCKLAERHSNEVNLSQRIEYLSRAIVCMKSSDSRAVSLGTEATAGEFLHELEEKMEVARIQSKILEDIKQLPDSNMIQEAIVILNSDLLDITKLYEEFADRFNFPEHQLAILHSAGHFDPSLIETLWQKLIDNEIKLISTKPNESQQVFLANKIIMLANQYKDAERYFPIEFIIKNLEQKTQNLNFTSGWLAERLLRVGFTLPHLLSYYHKIYKSCDSAWPRKSLQLLQVMAFIIKLFSENPLQVLSHERNTFTTKCLDVISGYLIDLQLMNASDFSVKSLITTFKSLKTRLEKCL